MSGTLTRLPDGLQPQGPAAVLAGADHVSRRLLTRLLDADPTDDDRTVQGLREEYDRQAAEWDAWTAQQPDYVRPLEDLLARRPDVLRADDVVLEVGAGTTSVVAAVGAAPRTLLVLDIAWEMIRRMETSVPRLQADVRRVPVRSASIDVVVGLNAVPCWPEFRRVLRRSGRLLWLSSFGLATPIVVTPEQLAAALPEATVTWARAGHGFWVVAEELACTG